MRWHLTIIRAVPGQREEMVFHGSAPSPEEAAAAARYAREERPGREYRIMVRAPNHRIEQF
jgi:hypothetical protein